MKLRRGSDFYCLFPERGGTSIGPLRIDRVCTMKIVRYIEREGKINMET